MGPVLEQPPLVPPQSGQVGACLRAEAAPQDEIVARGHDADGIELQVAQRPEDRAQALRPCGQAGAARCCRVRASRRASAWLIVRGRWDGGIAGFLAPSPGPVGVRSGGIPYGAPRL
ncbi:hypothetical protein GCM10018965_099020 [Nonomuraea roseola]